MLVIDLLGLKSLQGSIADLIDNIEAEPVTRAEILANVFPLSVRPSAACTRLPTILTGAVTTSAAFLKKLPTFPRNPLSVFSSTSLCNPNTSVKPEIAVLMFVIELSGL